MPMNRTPNQIKADRLDLELDRLIGRICCEKSVAWAEIALDLAEARVKVRAMMHPEDRKATA